MYKNRLPSQKWPLFLIKHQERIKHTTKTTKHQKAREINNNYKLYGIRMGNLLCTAWSSLTESLFKTTGKCVFAISKMHHHFPFPLEGCRRGGESHAGAGTASQDTKAKCQAKFS